MTSLIARDSKGKPCGTIQFDGKQITSTNPTLSDLAERFVHRYGSARLAFAKLTNWGNGYLTLVRGDK